MRVTDGLAQRAVPADPASSTLAGPDDEGGDTPEPAASGPVIVDDGIATGSTMASAIAAVRQLKAGLDDDLLNLGYDSATKSLTFRLMKENDAPPEAVKRMQDSLVA